jgi:hypothetical protein
MPIKVCFIYDPKLNEDGVSAYMDIDTTFGVKIAAVCAALGWNVAHWTFFFGPYDDARWSPVDLRKYRTPRSFNMDDTDEIEILCVPALAHN